MTNVTGLTRHLGWMLVERPQQVLVVRNVALMITWALGRFNLRDVLSRVFVDVRLAGAFIPNFVFR